MDFGKYYFLFLCLSFTLIGHQFSAITLDGQLKTLADSIGDISICNFDIQLIPTAKAVSKESRWNYAWEFAKSVSSAKSEEIVAHSKIYHTPEKFEFEPKKPPRPLSFSKGAEAITGLWQEVAKLKDEFKPLLTNKDLQLNSNFVTRSLRIMNSEYCALLLAYSLKKKEEGHKVLVMPVAISYQKEIAKFVEKFAEKKELEDMPKEVLEIAHQETLAGRNLSSGDYYTVIVDDKDACVLKIESY